MGREVGRLKSSSSPGMSLAGFLLSEPDSYWRRLNLRELLKDPNPWWVSHSKLHLTSGMSLYSTPGF